MTTHALRTTRKATRVELGEPGDVVTDVPYWMDGVPSRWWIDLRLNPDLIDVIDDLRGRPALREQIILLNQPDGPFMTIVCARATTRWFQQAGPPAWRAGSSVQFAFADQERATS
jgi:hypothetical protein